MAGEDKPHEDEAIEEVLSWVQDPELRDIGLLAWESIRLWEERHA